jgi:methionyl-tRNA formyltransferase
MEWPVKRLVMLTAYGAEVCAAVADVYSADASVTVVRTIGELERAGLAKDGVLLSFGTGIIVPSALLSTLVGPAWNLHPGTPDFPGRDPHHHAVYRGANEFGATLHRMTAKVDDGDIVAVETFPVIAGDGPQDLMNKATRAGISLLRRIGTRLFNVDALPPLAQSWGPIKTRRADMLSLCRISPDITAEELERRIRAFEHRDHQNLHIVLHGRRFVLDSRSSSAET